MKHRNILAIGCCIALAVTVHLPVHSVPNLRVWEIIDVTTSELDTVESLVELLPLALPNNAQISSVLETIIVTGGSLNSVLDAAITDAVSIEGAVSSLDSMIERLGTSIDSFQNSWQGITTNDFGGTWTLIDDVDHTLNNKMQQLQSVLQSLNSAITIFTVQDNAYFAEIFDELAVISSDVYTTLTTAQYTESQINTNISAIINAFQLLQQVSRTVNSHIDVIDVTLENGFVNTFTMLQAIENVFFSIESNIANIQTIFSAITLTFTGADLLLQETETISSKIDIIGTQVSIIDPLAGTVESLSDILTVTLATVGSSVDYLEILTITIDSIVDAINNNVQTIVSFLDTTNTQNNVFSGMLTVADQIISLDSRIEVLNSDVDLLIVENASFDSTIDAFGSYIDLMIQSNQIMISDIEILEQAFAVNISTLDMVNSYISSALNSLNSVDSVGITSKIARALSVSEFLDSSVAVLITTVPTINSFLSDIYTKDSILDSLIDFVASPTTLTIQSKISFIDSIIFSSTTIMAENIRQNDINSSIVDGDIRSAISLQAQLLGLEYDFQQTWTILQSIQNSVNVASSSVKAVATMVSNLVANPHVDFTDTYSSLARLDINTQTLTSSVVSAISIASRLDCISQTELNGTYTVLDQISRTAMQVGENALLQVNVSATILENFGIPIAQSDVGTTGTILSVGGNYYLSENITFTAASSGLAAITIAVSNINLAMQRRTLAQGGSMDDVVGVRINPNLSGISIVGGAVRNFSGNGIEVLSFSNGIFVTDMNIINVCGHGIEFTASSTAINIQGCIINNSCGNGIDVNTCSDISVRNCMLSDNGFSTTNAGILVTNSQKMLVSYCMSTTNSGDGYSFVSTTTHTELELYFNKAYKNSGNGFNLTQIQNSVIQGCICSENSKNGFNLADCQTIDLLNNICMNNIIDGIALSTNSIGTSNCYIAGNSFLLTGSVNVHEKSGSGPNCILSNLALSVNGGNNYVSNSGQSYLNFITVSESGTFPIASPVKWYNISMTT